MKPLPRPVLIAAISGRALAAAVRRGGEAVVIADLFGDEDTRELGPWHAIGDGLAAGIDPDRLNRLVERLREEVSGIACGSGFEAPDGLLEGLAARVPLLGNAPETVRRVKDPVQFGALLDRLGLPHPEIRVAAPLQAGWLRKRVGGSGGSHIVPAHAGTQGATGEYFQPAMPGTPVSALFVADGRRAQVLGFSRQWTAGTSEAPFRYGGCAGPFEPPGRLATRIAEAASMLAEAVELVGLNSLDLLIEEESPDGFRVLELNPRPGATLDIFDAPEQPLWLLHRAALAGTLPAAPFPVREFRAAAIAYAPGPALVPSRPAWPRWVCDRPLPRTPIDRDAPICTALAQGSTLCGAERLARARVQTVLDLLTAETAPSGLAS